jgi:hypothetical protein
MLLPDAAAEVNSPKGEDDNDARSSRVIGFLDFGGLDVCDLFSIVISYVLLCCVFLCHRPSCTLSSIPLYFV